MHTPELAERMAAARRRGGAQASKLRSLNGRRAKLDTMEQLTRFVAGVIHDTIDGTITPDVSRAAVAGLTLQAKLLEVGSLEARLAQLEATAAQQQDGSRKWA